MPKGLRHAFGVNAFQSSIPAHLVQRWLGHSDIKTILSSVGGPLLFLVGTILFKLSIRGFLQLSHGVGILVLAAIAFFAGELSPLMLSIITTAVLIAIAIWESLSLRDSHSKPVKA